MRRKFKIKLIEVRERIIKKKGNKMLREKNLGNDKWKENESMRDKIWEKSGVKDRMVRIFLI